MRNQLPAARVALGLLVAACFSVAQAVSETPTVVHGQATFNQQGNVFSITNTPNTILNWQNFNVAAGDITRFIQQSSDSAVLNRIVGQNPSQILGALQSNGHVFLINPNGIVFGRDAQVNVKGLTASTLAIADNDFLSGKRSFAAGPTAGNITQQGSITTPSGGSVFLMAPGVDNSGVITAPDGQIVLAAGRSVQLADAANPALHVVVSAPEDRAINLGQMVALGGKVGIYGALVAQKGVINADAAVRGANGQILLRATRSATLDGASVTSAAAGQVSVEGERVALLDTARVDASGAGGGGTVLIGGGYQGRHPWMSNTQHLLMGRDTVVRADAIGSGSGGAVVLWGASTNRARGTLSARGAGGGKGGLVETSGRWLDVNGARVQAGTWLLDPEDIEIVADGAIAALELVDEFGDPSSLARLNASMLSAAGYGTNIVLQATHDIKFDAPVNAALGTGSLTVDAGNNIYLNSQLSTGGGAVTLTANHPAYASGNGQIIAARGASLETGGGQVTLNAAGVSLAAPVTTGSGNLTINARDSVLLANNIATGNGELAVNARDIAFGGDGGFVNTSAGSMRFNALGGGFDLGPNWLLTSGSVIDVRADTASLLGSIGGTESSRPMVNFAPASEGRGIDLVGDGAGGTLELDAARLASFDVLAYNIGHGGVTGDIRVLSPYSGGRAAKMLMRTQGNILVGAPVLMPEGQDSALVLQVEGGNHTGSITTLPDVGSATVTPGGRLAADHLSLVANNMSLNASLTATGALGQVSLSPHFPTARSVLGVGAEDGFDVLGLNSSELAQVHAARLRIGATSDSHSGGVSVTAGGADFSSILDSNSMLQLQGGLGAVALDGKLVTPGALLLQGAFLRTGDGASAKAKSMYLDARGGIGDASAPFATETANLAATNATGASTAPIRVSNTGALTLGSVMQSGSENQGDIAISTSGELLVSDLDEKNSATVVRTQGGGAIALAAGAGLSVVGEVRSDGGAIDLQAGPSATMRITSPGRVRSDSGDIALAAQALVNDGQVEASNGNISLDVATLSGAGQLLAPNGTVSGRPAPTVAQCVADRLLSGCDAVIKAEIESCIVNPAGPNCIAVLPTLPACVKAPATYGCAVVLPKFSECMADPAKPGCSAVLPPLASCIADPALTGCTVVLPTLSACVATPGLAGCSVVLPSLSVCIASPSTPGCSVILPTLSACVGDPTLAGCAVVLPSLSTCTASAATAGCAVVLPSLSTCVANPGLTGCSAVLPSLSTCVATPATDGCSAVLPSLSTCVASPVTAGCSAVLPTAATCAASPATTGCAVLLPSLATCISAPATAGCASVLPSLASCSASPATPGCAAVLPSLATCVGNPAAAGCSAVLPTLSICSAAPATPGCSVVLPSLASCTLNPAAPGCLAVLPTLTACIGNPAAAGCTAVLPSMTTCMSQPSAAGCTVVLPSLSSCVADPARAGCVAVLPTLAQCTGSPSLQGCSVVLPTAEMCAARPTLQGCAVVLPAAAPVPGTALEKELAAAADKSQDAADQTKEDRTAPIAAVAKPGEKDVRKKTYCN